MKYFSYFLMEFNYPPSAIPDLHYTLTRDIDIIRTQIFEKPNYPIQECTLEAEMKPAPYRYIIIVFKIS